MDLLEYGSANVLGEIKNCGKWSEIVAVMLPEIMSFEITLLKHVHHLPFCWREGAGGGGKGGGRLNLQPNFQKVGA